jgi:hypothetical protein
MLPMPLAQLRNDAPLRPELEASLNEFAAWWREQEERIAAEDDVKETLYHYTSMAGLLGIVQQERLWFTNMFHLNGPGDHSIGIGIAHDILKHKSRSSGIGKEFCDRVSGLINNAGGDLLGPFIASFSSDGEDLEQWRAYADDGRGAALGLAPGAIAAATGQALIARVNYDRSKCHSGMNRVIQRAVSILWQSNFRADEERLSFIERLAADLSISILFYAATTRDPSHAHEKEIRIVLSRNLETMVPNIETRIRDRSLVPYIPGRLPLRPEEDALTRIVVGPAATEVDVHAVSLLVQAHGLAKGRVTRFAIPHTAVTQSLLPSS